MSLGDYYKSILKPVSFTYDFMMFMVWTLVPGATSVHRQRLMQTFQNELPNIHELVTAFHKGNIDLDHFEDQLSRYGINNDNAKIISDSTLSKLSLNEILFLYFWYRNEKDPVIEPNQDWLNDRLKSANINPHSFLELVEANRPRPTLQDILLFMDRDVFNESAAETLGLYTGLERQKEFLVEGKRRGMREQDLRYYYASHWRPPSLNMAFQMFQRLSDHPDPEIQFGEKELLSYFDIAEIPPGMRKSLRAVSFRRVTRVDVRRIHKLGVYGEGQGATKKLVRAYKEIGYSTQRRNPNTPSDAELMAEFTIRFNSNENRELTRTQLQKFYKQGLFDQDPNPLDFLRKRLIAIGYTEENASIISLSTDIERKEIIEEEQLDLIEAEWLNGNIESESELLQRLNQIGLTDSEKESQVRILKSKQARNTKRISVSIMEKAVRLSVADFSEYEKRLMVEGYNKRDREIMIGLLEFEDNATQEVPSKEDVVGWYSGDFITSDEFTKKMRTIGYDLADIQLYAQSVGKPL